MIHLWAIVLTLTFLPIIAEATTTATTTPNKTCDSILFSPNEQLRNLQDRYQIDASEVEFTAKKKIPTILRKTTHNTLAPTLPDLAPVRELKEYDVIIVGGGPAGLTSAVYLTNEGKRVLLVEREEELGGLAAGATTNKMAMGVGAAYSAGPTGMKQYNIFRDIGLWDYKKKLSIHEPIDSLLLNGVVYEHVWNDHTLEKLPASFALFKFLLLELSKKNYKDPRLLADIDIKDFFAGDYIRKFPEIASRSRSPKVRAAYQKYLADPSVDRQDPMKVVIDFLDLYGRSALGGNSEEVPAKRYCYFYASELKTRFTGALGTGFITEALLKTLKKGQRNLDIRLSSPVAKIENTKDGAFVTYINGGKAFTAKGAKVIFAAPLPLASKIIKDFEKADPEKAKVFADIQMTDYAVHVVHVKGHPYRQTYDLWMRPHDYTEKDPTDIILGRWMDPKILGYEGMRDFKKHPDDDYGILTIYHPIGLSKDDNFSTEKSLAYVEYAIQRMHDNLDPIVKKDGQKIEVLLVESYRWPYAIHRVGLGHERQQDIMQRSLGNIEFANNNITVPEIESAMELGYDTAMKILAELNGQRRISAGF